MKSRTFKKLLKHYGSQSAIAKAAGVSRATVSHWANGTNGAGAKSAIRLSRDCGVPAEEICGDLK